MSKHDCINLNPQHDCNSQCASVVVTHRDSDACASMIATHNGQARLQLAGTAMCNHDCNSQWASTIATHRDSDVQAWWQLTMGKHDCTNQDPSDVQGLAASRAAAFAFAFPSGFAAGASVSDMISTATCLAAKCTHHMSHKRCTSSTCNLERVHAISMPARAQRPRHHYLPLLLLSFLSLLREPRIDRAHSDAH